MPLGQKGIKCVIAWFATGFIAIVLALFISLIFEEHIFSKRLQFAYLTSFAFVLSLGLGGLLFVILTHLFKAGWSVVIRRPAEALAGCMPVLLLMFLPISGFIAFGDAALYPWAKEVGYWEKKVNETSSHASTASIQTTRIAYTGTTEKADHNEHHYDPKIMLKKQAYLNIPFYMGRWAVFFLLWILASRYYWRMSVKQDQTADYKLTNRMEGWAPINTLMFALTITFCSFDLLMSLDPMWFSTIFGVYYFTGSFLGAICLIILLILMFQKMGVLVSVNVEHMHDLGKLLFAFVFFWGYIAFSQYMLIWYGNLPEETMWYELHGFTSVPSKITGWTYVGLILLTGQLCIPFVGLLSRHAKRNMAVLSFWSFFLLFMHYIDMWWIVMPMYDSKHVTLGLIEITTLIGLTCLLLGYCVLHFSKHNPVPTHDPRLNDSLGFHNI